MSTSALEYTLGRNLQKHFERKICSIKMVGICRLCAAVRKRDTLSVMDAEVCRQLRRCFSVHLRLTDAPLPKYACNTCLNSLRLAYAFYEKILESQESLAALFACDGVESENWSKLAKGDKSVEAALQRTLTTENVCEGRGEEKDTETEEALELTESMQDANLDEAVADSRINEDLQLNHTSEADYLVEVYELVESGEQVSAKENTNAIVRNSEADAADNSGTEDECETTAPQRATQQLGEEQADFTGNDGVQQSAGLAWSESMETPQVNSWSAYSWRCYLCSHSFNNFEALREHALELHGVTVDNMQYMCVDCQKICARYNTFLNHVRLRHHATLALRCDACDMQFIEYSQLASHRQVECSELAKYPEVVLCNVCGKCFPSCNAARVHAREQHVESARRYHCAHCNKSMKHIGALRAHERIHTDVKDYTCELCGREFRQKANLDVHLYAHISEKNYECSICKKSLKTAINLERHKLVHRDIKRYQCDHCEKKFRTRDAKLSHERTHTGEKPYLCVYCNRRFRFRSTFISHVYTHTGERPYSCLECNHHFTNWPNYNKHMKRRHGKSATATENVGGKAKKAKAKSTMATPEEMIEITVMQSDDLE